MGQTNNRRMAHTRRHAALPVDNAPPAHYASSPPFTLRPAHHSYSSVDHLAPIVYHDCEFLITRLRELRDNVVIFLTRQVSNVLLPPRWPRGEGSPTACGVISANSAVQPQRWRFGFSTGSPSRSAATRSSVSDETMTRGGRSLTSRARLSLNAHAR